MKHGRLRSHSCWLRFLVSTVLLLVCLAVPPAQAQLRLGNTLARVGPGKIKRLRPMESLAVLTATNGILTVDIEDAGTDIGVFTISTGASHPQPGQTVFFPLGTSYITLRDATALQMWVNGGGASPGLAGYTLMLMNTQPAVVTTLGTTGFRTTYTLPSFTVVQDVVINGSTLSDTNVRHSVTVTNTTRGARQFGLRYMWDWQIAGNDASFFRPRNPDGAFTSTFATFAPPTFQLFEEVDNTTTPTFSVFGTVMGGSLVPVPTPPDQLRYSDWGAAFSSAWDFTNTGGGTDSATEHYWGFNTPLSLAARASSTFHQYVSTVQSAVGQPTPTPTSTPAITPTPTRTPTRRPTPAFAADFSYSPAGPRVNQPVQFTDLSTGGPTSWSWNFGDVASGQGNTSALQNPAHTFASSGIYTITLVVMKPNASSQAQKVLFVANATPTDTPTITPTNTPTITPTRTPTNTPTITPTITPTGTVTNTATMTPTITPTNTPTVTPVCSTPGAPVNVEVSPQDNPTGPVTGTDYLALSWSPPSTGPAPADYQYRINGDAYMTVSGTAATANPRGSSDAITLFVRARCNALVVGPEASSPVYSPAPPTANFTFSAGRVDQAINFTDTSTPQATSWLWIFDDGGTATTQSPSHTFTAVGSHSVILIASNGSGASEKIQFVPVAAASTGIGLENEVGSAGSEPDRLEVQVVKPQRSFTAAEPGRLRLRNVAVSGRSRMWLRMRSGAVEETIVYLRFLDPAGHAVLERRLSIPAGQEAVNDIGAYGLEGRYTLELVSARNLAATLAQPRPCRDSKENCDELP
jgi:PKD repeat protein